MTSQVSSPAEQADGAGDASESDRAVGDQRAPASVQEGAGEKEVRRLDRVIIRFAGDSGDGMQLTGDRFTSETASFGNDLSTLPNFPA
ncbi:2-oxoglutarate ferredoxin oxidoreductase subunit alpha, partial [Streptomyces sp. NPDC059569]